MNGNICNGMTVMLNMDVYNSNPESNRPRIPEKYRSGDPFYLGTREGHKYPRVTDRGYVTFDGHVLFDPGWFESAYHPNVPSTVQYKDLPNGKLKNGMLARFCVNAYKADRKFDLPFIPPKYATGKPFQVGIDNHDPWINQRGMVVFDNVYDVDPTYFIPVEMVDEVQSPATYTIVIEHGIKQGTLEVLEINGVVSHEYHNAGLLVKLTEDEQLYTWSYGLGIDTITVTKTEN